MKVTPTSIPEVLIIEPKVFGDERGYFYESFNQETFNKITGLNVQFVQDNHSRSAHNVLRGLHYQLPPFAQGKLVRCTRGAVWDVAVDVRQISPTFGCWTGVELTEDNHKQFWIPPGFAHGFIVLSEEADFLYKTTAYYNPTHDRCIVWDDPTIAIQWPLTSDIPKLSVKDIAGKFLISADLFT
jgi:dTDP-4-dehydrorhamnose 3,5-epimerase